MARTPSWYDHVDGAMNALAGFSAPAVERSDVERLFRLSRRDAIRLMHRFGAVEKNDRLQLSVDKFAKRLSEVKSSAAYLAEQRRRSELRTRRVELQRDTAARRFLLPISADAPEREAASMPDDVRLYRNALVVRFGAGSHEDLLARLLEVARIARDDPDGFQDAVERAPLVEDVC